MRSDGNNLQSLPKSLFSSGMQQRTVFPGAPTTENNLLSIRLLSQQGGFENVIVCERDTITVVNDLQTNGGRPIREALKSADAQIVLREGSQQMLTSEVSVVGKSDSIWNYRTPRAVIGAASTAREHSDMVLQLSGLSECADEPLSRLSECALGRLSIIAALFCRAKALIFDDPFDGISLVWVEDLAALMLYAAENSGRFFIVTGLPSLPKCWQERQSVKIQELGTLPNANGVVEEPAVKALTAFQELVRRNHETTDIACDILTHPQTFNKPPIRAAVPEVLQKELIENPNLAEMLPQQNAPTGETKAAIDNENSTSRRRTGTLTQLNRWHILSRVFRRSLFGSVYFRLRGIVRTLCGYDQKVQTDAPVE